MIKTATEEQLMYFTSLICQTLPDSYKQNDYIHQMGLSTEGEFIVLQLLLSNQFKTIINTHPEASLSTWKNNLIQLIFECFTTEYSSPVVVMNLQPFTRTLILRIHGNKENSRTVIENAFTNLCQEMTRRYQGSIIGCFGTFKDQIFDLSSSYKKASQLQEYSYIIGLSHSAFYESSGITTDYSLVEYKYIHLFDELFAQKDWINLYELLNRIKESLIENFINNSKTIYLYKEIYGITIRHLFSDMTLYKNEIGQLNEGINLFEHLFDDIHTVHSHYLSILKGITKESSSHFHPSIKKALKIIENSYMEPLSLNYLSESLMLSTAYFSRLFKEELGMNFKEYLTDYRINIAKSLLTNSNKDISEIATSIGYTSSSQMVRVFKALEGMTPTAYRHLRKG